MKQVGMLVVVVAVLLAAGCAHERPGMEISAEVSLPKADIAEIREAFKNSSQEKRVGLSQMGEAVCVYAQCGLEFSTSGNVTQPEKEGETAKMRGYLVFSKKSAAGLLKLIELAREHSKSFQDRGARGSVQCDSKACSLKFTMKRDAHLVVEGFFSRLTEDTDPR